MTTLKPSKVEITAGVFVNMFKPITHPKIGAHLLLLEN